MTNNNLEDLDQPGMEPNGGLPPPQRGLRANLSEAWRTKPLFKLFVIMALVGAVIAVSITLFSGSPPVESSRLFRPPKGLNQPPGGPSSPYFIEQTEKAEAERANAAMQSGGSALPTPIGSPTNLGEAGAGKKAQDPLVELRAETEHLKQQLAQVQQQQQQQPARQPEQFDDSLARAMQKELERLMDGWEPHGIKNVLVTKEEERKAQAAAAAATTLGGSGATAISAADAANTSPLQRAKTIVPAGTVSYAELLTEANSDVPGPILAQIVSGPLSGARAVGAFKVMNEYLVLTFTLVNFKGKDYQINAIALDPNTTLGGMATEVDERWFTRVVLPAAAGFMQGFGAALSQGSSSIVTNGTTTIVQQSGKGISQGAFQGVAQAGQTLGQYFQNAANNVQPLVRVAAGTPMGLFFTTSVTDQTYYQQQPYSWQPGMAGYPGAGSYNGTSPAGYYPGMSTSLYPGQTPVAGTPLGTTNTPYPYATAPYPALTNYNTTPNTSIIGASPYGIGTPIITH